MMEFSAHFSLDWPTLATVRAEVRLLWVRLTCSLPDGCCILDVSFAGWSIAAACIINFEMFLGIESEFKGTEKSKDPSALVT